VTEEQWGSCRSERRGYGDGWNEEAAEGKVEFIIVHFKLSKVFRV